MAQELPETVITTTAAGEVELVPDHAVVRVGVDAIDSAPSRASQQAAALLETVYDTLAAHGFPAESLPTTGYSVRPQYDFAVGGGSELTGYRATTMVRVTVRELARLPAVLEAVLAAGATNVGSIQYFASDYRAARDEATRRAVAEARRDAEVLAEIEGGRLGPLLELETGLGSTMPGSVVRMRAQGAPSPITPEQLTVRAAVTGRWLLVPRN
jgi:uncharacterized protein YggE